MYKPYHHHRSDDDVPFILKVFATFAGVIVFVGGIIVVAAIVFWVVKQAGQLAGWW